MCSNVLHRSGYTPSEPKNYILSQPVLDKTVSFILKLTQTPKERKLIYILIIYIYIEREVLMFLKNLIFPTRNIEIKCQPELQIGLLDPMQDYNS